MITFSYFQRKDGTHYAMKSDNTFQHICIAIYKEMQKGNQFLKMESVNPDTEFKKDLTSLVIKAIKPKGRVH